MPVEFISTTSAAKVLTDYWRENGHPSQPRDRDPLDYDFDLKDFKPGPSDIVVEDAGKQTTIVVSKSHVAPTKILDAVKRHGGLRNSRCFQGESNTRYFSVDIISFSMNFMHFCSDPCDMSLHGR